jgi:protein SCO1/2
MKQILWLFLGLLVGLLAVAFVLFPRPYQLRGYQINPPSPAPDFTLPDSNGQKFSLDQHKGQIVLIYFGYSNCPDICPTTLAQLEQVKKLLGGQSSNIEVVFITVDPARDTAERLKGYLAGFDPQFVGLTGTLQGLQPVWKAYGVYQLPSTSTTAGDSQIDHSSHVYLIDRQGNLRLTYPFGTSVDDMVQDIKYLLKG